MVIECTIPPSQKASVGGKGVFFIRPEDITLTGPEDARVRGHVRLRTFLGDSLDYRVIVDRLDWRIKTDPQVDFAEGQSVGLHLRHRGIFLTR